VGLGIFFASLAVNVARGYRWLMTWRSPEGLYPLAFFAYWVLYSLTESTVPESFGLNWVMYVSIATSLLIDHLPDPLSSPLPTAPAIGQNQAAASLRTAHETLSTHSDSAQR
jgi:O-antigen ligase